MLEKKVVSGFPQNKVMAADKDESVKQIKVAAMPKKTMHQFEKRETVRSDKIFLLLLAKRCKKERRAVRRDDTGIE